ncbi:MAG: SAM-dependent methyltransferase [Glaciihabitans sp.]|nr:SAM-dependent methyltransferase [Glaciihabitans sp.]
MVTFSSSEPGTDRATWASDTRFTHLPPLSLIGVTHVTVVAAHPDDETLGAGGLIAECAGRGIPVDVIVVTDGGGSHPDSPTHTRSELAARRSLEVRAAVAELAPAASVRLLGYPDGRTAEFRDDIERDLRTVVAAGTLLVAPWHGDGHRDHRIVGEICAIVAEAAGGALLEYPIWMWHWATPSDERVPWDELATLELGHASAARKRDAIALHRSQIAPLGPDDGDEAVLGADFLEHVSGDREVFVTSTPRGAAEPDADAASAADSEAELPASYFDDLYTSRADPWRLATRWYEERKRAITIAALPERRFERGLEVGCSIGTLTAELAPRCGALLAIDISEAAVDAARERTAPAGNVDVRIGNAARGLPEGEFDLIVLSEVGYYLGRETLETLAEGVRSHLATGGTVVACHWRHTVEDYPLSGDEVHEVLNERLGLERTVSHIEADFVLEVFSGNGRSVAEREGFIA